MILRRDNQSTQTICDSNAVAPTAAMLRASPLKWYGSLCGYRSDLYDSELRKFRRVDIKANSCVGPTIQGCKRPSRVLSIWMNYA